LSRPSGWIVFLASALATLIVYIAGLRDGLGTIDSGELAAAGCTLGIPHPTGYPYYTLLARVVALLPGLPVLTRLHALSAVASAAAAGFASLAVLETLGMGKRRGTRRWARATLAVFAGTGWGFAPSVWMQAVENEVYGLHALFLAATLWLAVRWMAGRGDRDLLLLGYLAGLGMSHHLILLFAAPALAVAVLSARTGPRVPRARRRSIWLAAAALLVLGLSVELYLPLRSAREPLLDWGHPASLETWLRHASGWQYRTWLFPGIDFVTSRALSRIGRLWSDLGWVLPLAALPGAFVLWRRSAAGALTWGLLFVVGLVWASSYDIKDIAPYYAASDLAAAVLGAAGLTGLAARIPKRAVPFLAAAAGVLLVAGAGARWQRCAASGSARADHYARALLEGLPPGSVVVSRQWDTFVSASLYLQAVEGLRPDVTVLDSELLRRSWYFPQVDRWWPGFWDPVRSQVDLFLEDIALFEAGRPYDPSRIEGRYRALQQAIIAAYASDRPIAHTPEIEGGVFGDRPALPFGLVFLRNPEPIFALGRGPLPDPDVLLAPGPRRGDDMSLLMRRLAAGMADARAEFLASRGEAGPADSLRREAGRLRPGATARD